MRIYFSPQRRDDKLVVSKIGDTLVINDEAFNFSSLPDGATIPSGSVPCDWIVGPVERIDGEVHVTLILPHGLNPTTAVAFPEPITVISDGQIILPTNTESENVET